MKIIEVNHLYKKFVIDTNPLTMFNIPKIIIQHHRHRMEIMALNDINFEAHRGDSIGLIGENGSGKTVLLKILAGLYKKTGGVVDVRGEVAAFLQLGIGMERDLSALENIFLFGAIMGLGRKEIKKKLDNIVEFSEIENSLHCPIRDFSSGMVQRLAFSIVQHVKADVILLDEMLISSDANFRKKCYDVIDERLNASKIIIFTSHETDVIKKVCNKILWLHKGAQMAFGKKEEILTAYTVKNG